MILTAQEIEKGIPDWFLDDGPSSPFVVRLMFRGLASAVAPRFEAAFARFARVHDWTYWYGRLFGCPLDTWQMTRRDADAVLRVALERAGWARRVELERAGRPRMGRWVEAGYRRAAAIVDAALERFGQRAWDHAGRVMAAMGDATYADYMRRKGLDLIERKKA